MNEITHILVYRPFIHVAFSASTPHMLPLPTAPPPGKDPQPLPLHLFDQHRVSAARALLVD